MMKCRTTRILIERSHEDFRPLLKTFILESFDLYFDQVVIGFDLEANVVLNVI